MNPERLLTDELTYELIIRGLPACGTVPEKRKLLRDALRSENPEDEVAVVVQLDYASELEICERKLGDLQSELDKFNLNNAENDYIRLNSRFTHLYRRIKRLPTDGETCYHKPNLVAIITSLLDNLRYCYTKATVSSQCTAISSNSSSPDSCVIDLFSDEADPNLMSHISAPLYSVARSNQTVSVSRRSDPNITVATTMSNNPNLNNVAYSRPSTSINTNFEHTIPSTSRAVNIGNDLTYNQVNPILSSTRFPAENLNQSRFSRPYHVRFSQDNAISQENASTPLETRVNQNYSNNILPLRYQDLHTNTNNVMPSVETTRPDMNLHKTSPIGKMNVANDNVNSLNRGYDKPLSTWNITFDGSNISVGQFVERINELSVARNVSKHRLFNSAIEFFTGDALIWFRSVRPLVNSWNELVSKLYTDFLPSDYINDLWDEIRNRKQGQNEKVIIFIAVMQNLFTRLPYPPNEDVRIEQIKRNLQPYFQNHLALTGVNSITQLRDLCKHLEDTKNQIDRFKSTGNVTARSALEPDLSFRNNSFRRIHEVEYFCPLPTSSQHIQQTPSSAMEVAPIDRNVNNDTGSRRFTIKCWNCHQTGHSWRQCAQPLAIFCFGCGRANVTVHTCIRCSKNGDTERV